LLCPGEPDSLKSVPDQALEQLRKAVDAAAATFDRRGSSIKERELEMAVECAMHALGLEPLRQVALRLQDAWSGRWEESILPWRTAKVR
jgi:hypothetical protein